MSLQRKKRSLYQEGLSPKTRLGGPWFSASWILRGFLFSLTFLVSHAVLAAEDLVLDDFAQSDRLWVTTSRVEIRPVQSKVIHVKSGAELKIICENGSHVEEGEVWAVEGVERTRLDLESLELERVELKEKLENLELEHEERLEKSREEIETLVVERKRLEPLLEEEEIVSDEGLLKLVQDGLSRATVGVQRAQTRREALVSRKILNTERERLQLDFRKREFESKQIQLSLEYKVPFAGELVFLGSLAERVKFVPVTLNFDAGEPLAAIRNNNQYEAVLASVSPHLAAVPKDSLYLEIDRLREGRKISADFDRAQVNAQDVMLRESLVFSVRDEDVPKVRKRLRVQTMAAVYLKLEKKCHLVPKDTLIKNLPEGESLSNWDQVIKLFWSDAELVAEGQSVLAVARAIEVVKE